jgi:hypothetical protein
MHHISPVVSSIPKQGRQIGPYSMPRGTSFPRFFSKLATFFLKTGRYFRMCDLFVTPNSDRWPLLFQNWPLFSNF